MTDKPPTTDPEQQRADNEASRRQSGLDPRPEDARQEKDERTKSSPDRDRERS